MKRRFLLPLLLLALCFRVSHADAAPPASDELIKTLRQSVFKEDPSHKGVPGISADQIDEKFMHKLFAENQNALGGLRKILTSPSYSEINSKLGKLRLNAVLRIWGQVCDEFGVGVELNDAGKQNGALSDMDKFTFTDAQEILSKPNLKPSEVHKFLIDEFQSRLAQQLPGVSLDDLDILFIPGDGLMQDWRMVKTGWKEFAAQLDADVARLGSTKGLYSLPGAYKTQVYTRYLEQGKTIHIRPVEGDPTKMPKYRQVEGVPPGVYVSEDEDTRTSSKLYGNVPMNIDRYGAMGSTMQNYYERRAVKGETMKEMKYWNRETDTGSVGLTNLEGDYRRLMLEGRDSARTHFIRKFYQSYFDRGQMQRSLVSDLEEVQKILERGERIEIDKILGGLSDRPKHWTSEWRERKPLNINDTKHRLQYFQEEAKQIVQSARAAGTPLDMADEQTQKAVAEAAEAMFQKKLTEVSRATVAIAAERVMKEVFTREGFQRLAHLEGKEAAIRLVVERFRDLHGGMVYIEDPVLLEKLVSLAPPEVADQIEKIRRIAITQREPYRGKAMHELSAEELEKIFSESRPLLRKLLIHLGLNADDVPNIRGQTKLAAGTLSPAYLRRNMALMLQQEILSRIRSGEESLRQLVNVDIPAFFEFTLPQTLTAKGLIGGTWQNLQDIGTADSLGRIASAYIRGDLRRAEIESYELIFTNVPLGSKVYSLAKSLKNLRGGDKTPIILFLTKQILKRSGESGAAYGGLLATLIALKGMEQSLFEIGWHFYGKPTANEAVALVLMGTRGGIPLDTESSRLKQFSVPTYELLNKNALLINKIALPDLPREYQDQLIRAHFLTEANRQATEIGRSAPGMLSAWWEDRERIMAEIQREPDFWLRKLYFYALTHTDFFNTMQSHFPQGENWQRYDRTPPGLLAGVSVSELKDSYPDAYREVSDGVIWDHERIWLRRYFERWLTEWEAKFPPGFEFIMDLDNTLIAGDWRKAVVSQLINYYLEGEFISLSKDDSAIAHGEGPAYEQLQARYASAMQKTAQRVVEQGSQEALETQAILEELYWNQTLIKDFVRDFLDAAEKTPAYKPKKAGLKLNIPNPVARVGEAVRMDFTVFGDVKELPDDLDYKIEFTQNEEIKGNRPREVLKDDIEVQFGREIPDRELKILKHEAKLTVFSQSNPQFSLTTTAPLFWIDQLKPDESGLSSQSSASQSADTGPSLDALRALVQRAEAIAALAKGLCSEAITLARDGEAKLAESMAAISALRERINAASGLANEVKGILQQVDALAAEIYQAGERIAIARGVINDLQGKLCSLGGPGYQALDKATRESILRGAEADFEQAKDVRVKAGRNYVKAGDALAKLQSAEQKATEHFTVLGNLLAEYNRLAAAFDSGEDILATARSKITEAESNIILLGGVKGEGSIALDTIRRAVASADPPVLSEAEGLFGRIVAAEASIKDCPAQSLAVLDAIVATAKAKRQELEQLKTTLTETSGNVLNRDSLASLLRTIKDGTASRDTAEIFFEAIREALRAIKGCLEGLRQQAAVSDAPPPPPAPPPAEPPLLEPLSNAWPPPLAPVVEPEQLQPPEPPPPEVTPPEVFVPPVEPPVPPELPPSPPPPATQASGPFYLVFKMYVPDVMSEEKRGGRKVMDIIRNLTVEQITNYTSDKNYLVFYVEGAGLNFYAPSQFQVNSPYAVSLGFKGVNSKTKQLQTIQGALLLELAALTTTPAEVISYKPDFNNSPRDIVKGALVLSSAAGTFAIEETKDGATFGVWGGPLEAGWSYEMKQKNIVFLQQLAEMFDCFIATAVFGPQASEVEIFRRFRNQTLKNSVWGRAFINWYYDNGPVIAFYLYQHRELQPPIRRALGALAWILESSQQRSGAHYAR